MADLPRARFGLSRPRPGDALQPVTGNEPQRLSDLYPRMPADFERLLRTLGVAPGGAASYSKEAIPPAWPEAPELLRKLWVPVFPAPAFGVLPEPRQRLHIERFAERRPQAGLVVIPSAIALSQETAQLRRVLAAAFVEKLAAAQDGFVIYSYTPR